MVHKQIFHQIKIEDPVHEENAIRRIQICKQKKTQNGNLAYYPGQLSV